jgi:RimJ/RimL family protein N-acetyltransferase
MLVRAADRPGLAIPAVWLRPLSPGETDTVERVFDGMSAESRRMRFLAPMPRVSARALRRLADVDHDLHGCWVAAVRGTPVGLGRYIRLPVEPDAADLALDVVDEMQGQGLGTLLLTTIMVAAADAGVHSLVWTMDPTNVRVRRLGMKMGAHLLTESGVVQGRAAIPVVGGLDVDEVVRRARLARRAAAAHAQDVA